MRKIYLAALIIAALSCQFAYSGTEISRRLNINTPQTIQKLTRYNKAEENRMIREEALYEFFSVKVTTRNQKKFDSDRDGYLSGKELQEYLREYYR